MTVLPDDFGLSEPILRFSFFAAIFGLLACAEYLFPRRRLGVAKRIRWPANLGVLVVDTLVVRLLVPAGVTGIAVLAEERQWGLLAQANGWLAGLVALLVLDLVIYWQHVLFHRVSWLWYTHRMHHADLDFDVTTAVRFHPIEIALSAGLKMLVVLILGAPALAIFLFEIILNAAAMFNHANIAIPRKVDRWLRWWIVTPDMHRIHHSLDTTERDHNFGFCVPWWDRLFGTYLEQPAAGHDGMQLGTPEFRSRADLRLDRMLLQPFWQHH